MFQWNIWYQGKEALTEIWTRCGCCILPLTPTPSPAWKVVVFYSNNRLCFCLCSVFPWRPEASVGVPRVWIKEDCKLPSVDSGSESVSSGRVVWALNCSAMPLILLLGGAFDQCLFIVYRVFVQELFPNQSSSKISFLKRVGYMFNSAYCIPNLTGKACASWQVCRKMAGMVMLLVTLLLLPLIFLLPLESGLITILPKTSAFWPGQTPVSRQAALPFFPSLSHAQDNEVCTGRPEWVLGRKEVCHDKNSRRASALCCWMRTDWQERKSCFPWQSRVSLEEAVGVYTVSFSFSALVS